MDKADLLETRKQVEIAASGPHPKFAKLWPSVFKLLDHIDALEQDALRYRWLRDHAIFNWERCHLEWYLHRFYRGDPLENLDQQLDRAIAAAPEPQS